MKDYELSGPSQEAQLRQPGGRQNGSDCVGPTSVSKGHIRLAGADSGKKNNSPPAGLPAKVSARQVAVEAVQGAAVRDESVSCISGNLAAEAGDFDQSEKPKSSKKRRRRRKGAAQQVVGLPPAPSAAAPVLLWFRRDLRLRDNPALMAAVEAGAPVVPVFIWSPEEEEGPGVTVALGGACKSGSRSLKLLMGTAAGDSTHNFLRSQVNSGSIKLCLGCVRLWSATAAISSSSSRRPQVGVDLL